jgi:hypothetical protein
MDLINQGAFVRREVDVLLECTDKVTKLCQLYVSGFSNVQPVDKIHSWALSASLCTFTNKSYVTAE